jgi:hypothetical protein
VTDDVTDDDEVRPRRKKRPSKKKKRAASSVPYLTWIIAGAGSLLALFVIWSLAPVMGGGWLAKGMQVDPAARAKAADLKLAKQQENLLKQAIESFSKLWGPGKYVIVVFNDVPTGSHEIQRHLHRKVELASRFEAEQEEARAKRVTDANYRQARQVINAETEARGQEYLQERREGKVEIIPDQLGKMGAFEFQGEAPKLPPGHVTDGPYYSEKAVFLATPVLDLDAFIARLDLGDAQIDATNRTVTLRVSLSPELDADIEELDELFGHESVVIVDIAGLQGARNEKNKRLAVWASELILKGPVGESASWSAGKFFNVSLARGGKRSSVHMKWLAEGRYRMVAGPVKDIDQFAKQIKFGTVEMVDPISRIITVQAKPGDAPPSP